MKLKSKNDRIITELGMKRIKPSDAWNLNFTVVEVYCSGARRRNISPLSCELETDGVVEMNIMIRDH